MSIAIGIEQFLKPFLGASGSRRLVLLYCSNNSKSPDDLTAEDLGKLGVFLREHLTVFVGQEKARHVLAELSTGR